MIFGRIEDTIDCFRDLLTFIKLCCFYAEALLTKQVSISGWVAIILGELPPRVFWKTANSKVADKWQWNPNFLTRPPSPLTTIIQQFWNSLWTSYYEFTRFYYYSLWYQCWCKFFLVLRSKPWPDPPPNWLCL